MYRLIGAMINENFLTIPPLFESKCWPYRVKPEGVKLHQETILQGGKEAVKTLMMPIDLGKGFSVKVTLLRCLLHYFL